MSDGSIKCIEENIPFNVPNSWSWSRFSSLTINRDSERKPISLKDRTKISKVYDYYGASGAIDKVDDYLFNERLLLIGEDGANLVTRSKPIAFFAEGKYWVNNHAHCIDATDKRYLDYICLYINSINLEKYITGAAQPKMNQDNMNSILIPVPPLEEQLRILNYVNELNDISCAINCKKEELLTLIEGVKSKILDLAIRGLLVPQDPNDEPASVLLDRIRSEKEELIKQGKIKRDKKESIIFRGDDNSYYETNLSNTVCIDDKIPFELPQGWTWTRLPSILQEIFAGGDKPKIFSEIKTNECNIPIFSNGVENEGLYGYTNKARVTNTSLTISGRGTIGFCCIRNEPFVPIVRLITIVPCCEIDIGYLNIVFKSLVESGVGSSIPQLTVPMISFKLVPLPPLNEQIRIAKMVKNYFDLIDIIVKNI